MAITLENLIDLDLLTYYDEQVKKWIADRVANATKETVFTTKNSLPVEGQKGILYVTEESIFIWNGIKYVDVGNPESTNNATLWGTF